MDYLSKKIAVVKQTVYQDLYCINSGGSHRDTVLSSVQRCGPVGLINECNADFYIVNVEPEAECNFWKQKSTDCGQRPISYYEEFANKASTEIPYSRGKSQNELAVGIYDVRWEKYDIVISIDIAFPSKFIQNYPKTLWCYMPGEPCMSLYRKSRRKLVENYHVFLNQEIRHEPFTSRPIYFPHFRKNRNIVRFISFYTTKWKAKIPAELDFPYTLVSSNSIKGLFDETQRNGIAMEFYTFEKFKSLGLISPYTIIEDAMHKLPYIRIPALVKTKYFICDSPNYKRGNGILEAMSAGCLCLTTKNQLVYNYQKLLGKRGKFSDLESLYDFIEYLEANPEKLESELLEQDTILNKYCFKDPLQRLFDCHDLLN